MLIGTACYAMCDVVAMFPPSGLHRPHLPFHVPASFPDETGAVVNHWEKYGPDAGIKLPTHRAAPTDMPGIAFTYEMDGQTEMKVQ